jgi:hypothetical protein
VIVLPRVRHSSIRQLSTQRSQARSQSPSNLVIPPVRISCLLQTNVSTSHMMRQTLSSAGCFYPIYYPHSSVPKMFPSAHLQLSFSKRRHSPMSMRHLRSPWPVMLLPGPLLCFPPLHNGQLQHNDLPENCHLWYVPRSSGQADRDEYIFDPQTTDES